MFTGAVLLTIAVACRVALRAAAPRNPWKTTTSLPASPPMTPSPLKAPRRRRSLGVRGACARRDGAQVTSTRPRRSRRPRLLLEGEFQTSDRAIAKRWALATGLLFLLPSRTSSLPSSSPRRCTAARLGVRLTDADWSDRADASAHHGGLVATWREHRQVLGAASEMSWRAPSHQRARRRSADSRTSLPTGSSTTRRSTRCATVMRHGACS